MLLGVDGPPLIALSQHLFDGFLGTLQGMVLAPATLLLIGSGNLGGVEDVAEGLLEDVHEVLSGNIEGDGVEAGLAPHRGEVDEAVGVVAHVLGRHVFNGMHRGHLQVLLIGLAEPYIELPENVSTRKRLFVGNADEGGANKRVIEVERLYIHAFFHGP